MNTYKINGKVKIQICSELNKYFSGYLSFSDDVENPSLQYIALKNSNFVITSEDDSSVIKNDLITDFEMEIRAISEEEAKKKIKNILLDVLLWNINVDQEAEKLFFTYVCDVDVIINKIELIGGYYGN